MRFIENVSPETIRMLQRIYKHSKHPMSMGLPLATPTRMITYVADQKYFYI